jgi:hypothetical protein
MTWHTDGRGKGTFISYWLVVSGLNGMNSIYFIKFIKIEKTERADFAIVADPAFVAVVTMAE